MKTPHQIACQKWYQKHKKEENIIVSPFLIRRTLKEIGVYIKYQKGIGDKSLRRTSINRCGKGNPNFCKKQSEELIRKRTDAINETYKNKDVIVRTFFNTN